MFHGLLVTMNTSLRQQQRAWQFKHHRWYCVKLITKMPFHRIQAKLEFFRLYFVTASSLCTYQCHAGEGGGGGGGNGGGFWKATNPGGFYAILYFLARVSGFWLQSLFQKKIKCWLPCMCTWWPISRGNISRDQDSFVCLGFGMDSEEEASKLDWCCLSCSEKWWKFNI